MTVYVYYCSRCKVVLHGQRNGYEHCGRLMTFYYCYEAA